MSYAARLNKAGPDSGGDRTSVDDVQQFFDDYSSTLETLFISRLYHLIEPSTARLFAEILALRGEAMQDMAAGGLTFARRRARAEARYDAYTALYDSLDAMPDVRQQILEAQAKLQDVGAIARKQSTVKILKAEHGMFGSSADDITYTFLHFAAQGVSPTDVQRYLDELPARFSLTSHPTNPTSLSHTKAGIALEQALCEPLTEPSAIIQAMDDFIRAPVAAAKKTPIEELEELMPVMDNLYAASLRQRDAAATALQVSGYADNGVHLRLPLLELEDWSATFDGDGNANATRWALEQGVALKERWIKGKYAKDMEALQVSLERSAQGKWITPLLQAMQEGLAHGKYTTAEAFTAALQELQDNYVAYHGASHPALDDLIYQSRIFGLHGSRGNIRHDAKSLQNTLLLLAEKAGLPYDAATLKDKCRLSELLSEWFRDSEKEVLAQLKAAAEGVAQMRAVLGVQDDDTSLRILERLQFLGERPDIANKLIIAEATHPADAKTAMALLYATGNAVASLQAAQEIVLLVESVPDVEQLDETVKTLAMDPIYQQHLQAFGRITVMIAHSDNRRRDGYSAGEIITSMEGKIARLQQELRVWAVRHDCRPLLAMADGFGVPIYIFDGGGNDLMRGAAVNPGQTGKQHGHAAARENAPTIRAPQNTIQGEQTRLLFGDPECAAMFLEMMVSQAMYAKASVEDRIAIPAYTLEPAYRQAQRRAQMSAECFHATARRLFHRYTDTAKDESSPFDALFAHSGAWITTLLANRGSRGNQRGESGGERDKTVREIRGHRKALDQRAITGNLLFQLTGTFHFGLLGQLEAFEAIGEAAAYEMFHSSLPDRTHILGVAQQLHMTHFTKAWRMMGKEEPTRENISRMAASFRSKHASGQGVAPEETLAFMQEYGLKLTAAIVQAAIGKPVEALFTDPDCPFEMQDAYRLLLPELARQLDMRHASHEAEHAAVARLEHMFSEYPTFTITPQMEMVAVAVAGALSMDVRPALGPMAVRGAKGMTSAEDENKTGAGLPVRESFVGAAGMERLRIPANLLAAAEAENRK